MKVRLIVAVLAVMPICPVWAQQAPTYDARPKITVSGEAVVNVKPDKIVISLGIETKDNDIMVAKQKNNDILKKAVAAVKECGVAEKDIQTDHLSIQPRWKIEYQHEEFLGYVVRNAFTVTLTDTAKVEELVTTVLLAGVNYIHGIDFQTTELKKYREQARELALKAAKEKAKKMVAALGPHEIGCPSRSTRTTAGRLGRTIPIGRAGPGDLVARKGCPKTPSKMWAAVRERSPTRSLWARFPSTRMST